MLTLGAAMQAGLFPVFIILNNASYGTIRMHQERTYPERVSGTDIVNPDFAVLARAYGGIHGETVTHTGEFAAAFERARLPRQQVECELQIETGGSQPLCHHLGPAGRCEILDPSPNLEEPT